MSNTLDYVNLFLTLPTANYFSILLWVVPLLVAYVTWNFIGGKDV